MSDVVCSHPSWCNLPAVAATDVQDAPSVAEFVNDPILAPGERAAVADRQRAGLALGWDPAVSTLDDLFAFVGDTGEFELVGADTDKPRLLRLDAVSGAYAPVGDALSKPAFIVRWLSRPVEIVPADEARRTLCRVTLEGNSTPRMDFEIERSRARDAGLRADEAMRERDEARARVVALEEELQGVMNTVEALAAERVADVIGPADTVDTVDEPAKAKGAAKKAK